MYLDIRLECGCFLFLHSGSERKYNSVIEDIFVDRIEVRPGKLGHCESHFPNLPKVERNPST